MCKPVFLQIAKWKIAIGQTGNLHCLSNSSDSIEWNGIGMRPLLFTGLLCPLWRRKGADALFGLTKDFLGLAVLILGKFWTSL